MPAAEPSHFRRRLTVSLVIVVLAIGLGHVVLEKLKGMKKEPERVAGGAALPLVRVVRLSAVDHREVLRGYGVARSDRQARVAAEVGGLIRRVAPELEVGNVVGPPPNGPNGGGPGGGDPEPLVRIDPQDLEDALDRLRAERTQALAEKARTEADVKNLEAQLEVSARRLETAKAELRRILLLVESETLSVSDADRQKLAVFALEQIDAELVSRRDAATASVAVVDARLELIDASERKALRDLERTRVFAPYAGRVSARYAEVGNLVAPGAPLFDLVDPSRVEVAIALPASRYGQVTAADDARTGSAGPGSAGPGSAVVLRSGENAAPVWEGRVARIDPGIDAASRTFRAYVVIRDPDGTPPVAPGAHVVADVEGALYPDVLTVPREAFVQDRVFVVEPTDEEGVFVAQERRPDVVAVLSGLVVVRPAARLDASDGLRPDDRVVVTNLEDIADGSKLRTLDAD